MPFGLIISLVLMVASYALQALTAKNNKPSPAGIGDFNFPTIEEGTPQNIVFGDVWVQNPLVAYYGNLRSSAIHGGGKK